MIRKIDIRNSFPSEPAIPYDCCIIGAGAAGTYLSSSLVHQGQRVCLIEAGGDICSSGAEIGFDAVFDGDKYGGAINGRSFGIGGTTALWGGQLLPYSKYDVNNIDSNPIFAIWPEIVHKINMYAQQTYYKLGLKQKIDFGDIATEYLNGNLQSIEQAGFSVLTADWLPFRSRNLRFLIDSLPKKYSNLDIYINAVASQWCIDSGSHNEPNIKSVVIRSNNGHSHVISAKNFVVAAGTIESARILLEIFSESEIGSAKVRKRGDVGNYLSDHLSSPIADVSTNNQRIVTSLFGPKFKNGRMKTFRLVNNINTPSIPNGFFHFIFEQENHGFNLARKALQGMQAKKIPKVTAPEVIEGMNGLTLLAYERYIHKRLYIPSHTRINLQFDMEQNPNYENCVCLASDRDEYGRLKTKVRWQIFETDYENMNQAVDSFLYRWSQNTADIAVLNRRSFSTIGEKLYDTYHPVGTCRMGHDKESVVDTNMKVHGLSNVFVASTAVFPSSGTANPTFSLLCLSEALAEYLSTNS